LGRRLSAQHRPYQAEDHGDRARDARSERVQGVAEKSASSNNGPGLIDSMAETIALDQASRMPSSTPASGCVGRSGVSGALHSHVGQHELSQAMLWEEQTLHGAYKVGLKSAQAVPSVIEVHDHDPGWSGLEGGSLHAIADGHERTLSLPEGSPCTIESQTLTFRLDLRCRSNGREEILRILHRRAYNYSKTALDWLEWMTVQNAQRQHLVWNWGKNPNLNHLWIHQDTPEWVALSHWFGAYSPAKLKTLVAMFRAVVKRLIGATWSDRVIYRCKIVGCILGNPKAKHLVPRDIWICPGFWENKANVSLELWMTSRSVTVLHEHFHQLFGPLTPRDERNHVCVGGWNAEEDMCYRTSEWDLKDWNYGYSDSNPVRLVESGQDAVALNNIDNYVCWALRRFRTFGLCARPTIPSVSFTSFTGEV
jgi:hypothetical protein